MIILGVAGKAGAGKDEVSNMISYIVRKGIARATFDEYERLKKVFDKTYNHNIIHFADNLKQVMSIMFNIPIEAFNSRVRKDYSYWCYSDNKFVGKGNNYIITENELQDNHFSDIIKEHPNACIKLRTLMQYFGTNIARNLISDNIWYRSTMLKAGELAKRYNICIISDVRFKNEADVIHSTLYGRVLYINRNSNIKSNHESEQIDFDYDDEIDNNDTLPVLFYRVLDWVNKNYTLIIKK